MPTSQRVDEPTPNGGAYSIAYFQDSRGEPVEKVQATAMEIVEFSADGKELMRTYMVKEGSTVLKHLPGRHDQGKHAPHSKDSYSVVSETDHQGAEIILTQGVRPDFKPGISDPGAGNYGPGKGANREGLYVNSEGATTPGTFSNVRLIMDLKPDQLGIPPESSGRSLEQALSDENGAVTVGHIPKEAVIAVEVYNGKGWDRMSREDYLMSRGIDLNTPELPTVGKYENWLRENVSTFRLRDDQVDDLVHDYNRGSLQEKLDLALEADLVALKHLAGRHNQKRHGWRFNGGIPASISPDRWSQNYGEQEVYFRHAAERIKLDLSDSNAMDSYFAKRRAELEAGARSELMNLMRDRLGDREATDEELRFYADMMSNDLPTFMRYGETFGFDLEAGEAYLHKYRNIDRLISGERWALENEYTNQKAGKIVFHYELGEKMANAAERGPVGRDLNEATQLLQERYGVSFLNGNGTNPYEAHEHISWLLNMAEENPAVAKILSEQTNQIVYMDHPTGGTAVAAWNDDTQTIRVYPSGQMNPSVWIHELGHGAEVYARDRVMDTFGRGRRASKYSWNNNYEDFAETFATIVGGSSRDLNWLKRNAPEKFAVIMAILEGEA